MIRILALAAIAGLLMAVGCGTPASPPPQPSPAQARPAHPCRLEKENSGHPCLHGGPCRHDGKDGHRCKMKKRPDDRRTMNSDFSVIDLE